MIHKDPLGAKVDAREQARARVQAEENCVEAGPRGPRGDPQADLGTGGQGLSPMGFGRGRGAGPRHLA